MRITKILQTERELTRQDDEEIDCTDCPKERHVVAELVDICQGASQQREDDEPAQCSSCTHVWRKGI
jgi:hypothetical protein